MATAAFLVTTLLPLVGLGGLGGVILGAAPEIKLGLEVLGLMKSLGHRRGMTPEQRAHLEWLETHRSDAQRFRWDNWP